MIIQSESTQRKEREWPLTVQVCVYICVCVGTPVSGSSARDAATLTPGSDGKEMKVDFSPKGGPPDLIAKWTGDGIIFPDGNKWPLIE